MWLSLETAIVVEASKSPARLAIPRICYPLPAAHANALRVKIYTYVSSFSPSMLVNFSLNLTGRSIYDKLFMTHIPGLPRSQAAKMNNNVTILVPGHHHQINVPELPLHLINFGNFVHAILSSG